MAANYGYRMLLQKRQEEASRRVYGAKPMESSFPGVCKCGCGTKYLRGSRIVRRPEGWVLTSCVDRALVAKREKSLTQRAIRRLEAWEYLGEHWTRCPLTEADNDALYDWVAPLMRKLDARLARHNHKR